MNATDFLELVLPSTGYIVIAEPIEIAGATNTPYRHHTFEDLDAAVDKAVALNFEHKNVFFALAGFQQAKVWNPTKEKWQTRTQANAGWMRSLFLDLDIEPSPTTDKAAKTFPTREDAITDLQRLCKKVGLPRPMILDSGGGWHIYWPFDRDLTTAEWQPLADKFKAICMKEGLRIDPAVPSDSARVLRLLGCHNLKRPNARPVELFAEHRGLLDPSALGLIFQAYETSYGIAELPRRKIGSPSGLPATEGNLQQDRSPLNFGLVSFACAVIGGQVASGGEGSSEPLWRATMGVAKFAVDPMPALMSVSDQHADFDIQTMLYKAEGWNAGPTTCNYFRTTLACTECASCPHNGRITSPAQLGNHVIESDAPSVDVKDPDTGTVVTITLPNPPHPYVRKRNKDTGVDEVAIRIEDKDGNPYFTPVSPNDFYPVRIMRHTASGEVQEKTVWRFHLPRTAPMDLEIRQGVLGDGRALHQLLLNAGLYAKVGDTKSIQDYMSAYLQHLSHQVDKEKIYNRLGWQYSGEHEEVRAGFVLGTTMFEMNGSSHVCNIHQNVKNTVRNGIHQRGDRAAWTTLLDNHYAADLYAPHRFFIYAAFAAPLYHMTGHKGTLIAANGTSGAGKTSVLKVASSIWGSPDALVLNGNPDGSTYNAMYNMLGTVHSLPMMWDDTTERNGEEILKIALNLSSGRGKERMKGSEHDGKYTTWETLVLSSTNYDNIAQAMATRKGTDANVMRVLGVEFEAFPYDPTGTAKTQADWFLARIGENYGFAGSVFMGYVTKNYDAVKQRVEDRRTVLGKQMAFQGPERFWSDSMAVAQVAAEIVHELGLLHFDLAKDFAWMKSHITEVREKHGEFKADPVEELSTYLEERISETLVLSSRATSNLDNIALRPQRQLTIRHEMDKGVIFISKAEVAKYCAEVNASIKSWEKSLVARGVLTEISRLKTLGADTNQYAKGQVRCWVVDATKLHAQFYTAVQQAVQAGV